MATLLTTGITLPKNIAAGLWSKAVTGSAVSQLSGQEPMQFGETTYMTFTTPPRAEYVAEGANKASSNPAFGTKVATPHKVQITQRFSEEVKWADEDYQLGILATMADAGGVALARALDLGIFHGIQPSTGSALASIVVGDRIATTTNRVEMDTAAADMDLEAAAGLVIADGYIPNGVALDPAHAWTFATARYTDGRKKYPELGLGTNVTSLEGLRASVSSTVSGVPEAADTDVRAIIGDWSQLRWGVQKSVPVELIEFGDPDGGGDLKRTNSLALRLEIVYGWAVMDLDAFAVVENAA